LYKLSLKSLYLFVICNLAHIQDGKTKVKFIFTILEKMHVGSETNWKVGSGCGKNQSGSTTLGGGGEEQGGAFRSDIPNAMIKNMSIMSRVTDPDPIGSVDPDPFGILGGKNDPQK
jgi:hypothetical protein